MFRVSINLFPNTPQRVSDPTAQAEARETRQDDWSAEIKEVESRLTEADVRETFSDKFGEGGRHLNKLA